MTLLKMSIHGERGVPVVEVYDDDHNFIASIYPHKDGVHIVSRHFTDDPISASVGVIPIPGYLVKLKRQP